MTAPSDVRLIDTPMQPLGCGECAATVLVRKSDWQQTSIQWNAAAQNACRERPLSCRGDNPAEQFAGCETLAASIRQASVEGRIEVVYRDELDQ
ncbi:hypothetical protein QNO00_13205 [Arthrobacter sp. zg-Y1219]|uniref:hypothetical protein n=1 Tax=Arthrobacter sp. zg-Y1219 TaxID=3049067 RepID=UPI0024C4139E|nr:hypothetical protein [Arthrobacter sp. zg-Y1219]MDK1361217.1 hypothetical protein [Arthrobacter sp. zg-Y1219]